MATSRLADPDLPVVEELFAPGVPGPVAAAVASVGARAEHAALRQVTWWPGSSCTARWDVEMADGGPLTGGLDIVATTKRAPAGALEVVADDDRVAVWAVPHDPFLPGLPAVLDSDVAADLVRRLGGGATTMRTRLRAHRPTRRAVVEMSGLGPDRLYAKVVRPGRARDLHDRHVELSEVLPVPPSLGVDDERGVVVMSHLEPPTLRRVLEDPTAVLPDPGELLALATGFPEVSDARTTSSPIERLPGLVELLQAIVPHERARLDWLLEAVGTDGVTDRQPVHGDFHEAQVLVDDGRVAGVLDVDGVGTGRPADDTATLLGHLAIWGTISNQPHRVRTWADEVLRRADSVLDPVDLRLRVAAVVAGLATGSFRVQRADWPADTSRRIDLALRWVASARRIADVEDEPSLTRLTG
ncbi:phosphotransferase [Salsipaludibacter albus]|uniref:phosphotransferase n=1 Tax=Salsipaludibacter albus TaxID=2849650 RepID=UPI001EE3E0F0|nr:phosphotransferase [Salsipaludibacter albus]MBY5163059.1 phosphotransferase [Salsipaludibacter albus]